ncbi:MAG TPA: EAL domain-containing protein [Acidimicrobiia bacterium]|nr:EAL domain-containing protein [Acidimicrobiia bacterium]
MVQMAGLHDRGRAPLSSRVSWWFLAIALGATAVSLLSGSDQLSSFLFDAIGIAAGCAAVFGILRNQPTRIWPWRLVAVAIVLSAAGDVIYDVAVRTFGAESGYPFADLFYLPAYPCLAIALWKLSGPRRRDTFADSAIVTLAVSAVIWQWVITPMFSHVGTTTFERVVAVTYPIMDVILVVAIVHAVFTLPRLITSARFLFAGLAVMLIADTVFARLVADSTYVDGGVLDALWPIAYSLLAAAILHPSMRAFGEARDPGLVRAGRARIVVLAAALFSVPAIVVIDGATSDEAVALTAIVAATAALVGWRITRLVTETNQAREEIGESEARFRALVQHSSDAVAVIDRGGIITFATPAINSILGRSPEEMVGQIATQLLHPDDVITAMEALEGLRARPFATVRRELRARHGDDSWRWLDATFTNQLAEPAITGIVANLRDITDRKLLERAGIGETKVLELVLSGAPVAETLQILLDTIEDFVGDAAAVVRLLDPDSGALLSVAAPTLPLSYVREVDEKAARELEQGVDPLGALGEALLLADLANDERYPGLPARAFAHGLRSFWALPIRGQDDTALGYLGVYTRVPRSPTLAELTVLERARDLVAITLDRAAHTQQLGFLALHDTLTTLPNRALGVERLDAALHSLPDTGPLVAALFIDLDRFKVVNDGLGHDAGDELLVAVGRRLAGAVRREDTVARFGGDEFVVICEHLRDEAHAVELAQRALDSLSHPFALARAEIVVTASIGIALTHRASDRASDLLRDADAAMYRAKRRGGGRFELFDHAMHTQAVTRLLTERALRQSLDREELRVLFQAQFDLATNERVAVEALLRWEHPVRGMIPPGDFLAVAEETGLIVPIGEWVMDDICDRLHLAALDDASAHAALPMSVNVSARQLLQANFTDRVRRALLTRELDPQLLCLEVAERVLLDDQDSIRDTLHALKNLGLRLAIDDFGTGGSSLTYLRRYPFDELKIDGTFVAGLDKSAADDAIVAATIDMAHALGMTVAAEGIETEEQRVRLAELGCERGQGYHLAPPEALDERHLRLVRRLPA